MKLIVNGIPLTGLQTGMSRYARCLYRELADGDRVAAGYLAYSGLQEQMPEAADPELWSQQTDRFWTLPDPVITAVNAIQRLRLERRLRTSCRTFRADLYHETDLIPPPRLTVPTVYTIHDLSLLKYRDTHPKERLWLFDLFFRRRIHDVSHIVTVSEFIRGEIIEELGVHPDRVTAVHEAPSSVFSQRGADAVAAMKARLRLPRDYVLFVGTQEPRKNLSLLIRALSLVKSPVPLVLAGWSGWGDRVWQRLIEQLGMTDRVYRTGYVDEETLACLYSGALVTVYPSLYEGFGLPVLEAMACGAPVICSAAASLPEVSGGAALQVDPHDPDDLAAALERILADSGLREQVAERGKRRAAQFSWNRCARETLQVFEKVARQG